MLERVNLVMCIVALCCALMFLKASISFNRAEKLFNEQSIKLHREYEKIKYPKLKR